MSDTQTTTLFGLNNDDINQNLKITDLENIFELYQDKRGNLVFDLNSTLYINVDKSTLPEFICDHPMQWALISYKIYGTTRLAWLLWKINDVGIENIFETKQPGDKIKYLQKQYVDNIVSNINNFDNP